MSRGILIQLAMHALKGFADDVARCAGDVADAYRELGAKVLEASTQGRQGSVTQAELDRCVPVAMAVAVRGRSASAHGVPPRA
jgi:hypothetical protein